MGYLKEKWTEDEVLSLPQGEHNYFERKAGRLFTDKGQLYEKVAKAISALANSGGGYLILGREDNGIIDGVPAMEGRTPIREWLEQKVPLLVAYPLESFRVHKVIRSEPMSQIPAGKELIVIDVGDSRLAPHQTAFPSDKPQYYYRQGGKSMLAPHHYLEALRNRLTYAVLDVELTSAEVVAAYPDLGGRAGAVIALVFQVKNVSRIMCNHWEVVCSPIYALEAGKAPAIHDCDQLRTYGVRPSRPSLRTDPILPTRELVDRNFIGFAIFGAERLDSDILNTLIPLEIEYYAISENHIGQLKRKKLGDVITQRAVRDQIAKHWHR